jgi:hypothetical protein
MNIYIHSFNKTNKMGNFIKNNKINDKDKYIESSNNEYIHIKPKFKSIELVIKCDYNGIILDISEYFLSISGYKMT